VSVPDAHGTVLCNVGKSHSYCLFKNVDSPTLRKLKVSSFGR
jgi:hypothetical protein